MYLHRDRSWNPDRADHHSKLYHINGVSSKAKNLPEVSSREAASIYKTVLSVNAIPATEAGNNYIP